jgi:hypothetical protein
MDAFFTFLTSNGVPKETIAILLMFPILASFIVISRQVIGIKAFGIYTPLIITFAFLSTGFRYGAAIFILALSVATLVHYLLQRIRILYLPKMALILSITVLSMFLLLIEGAYNDRTVLIGLSIYPLLIIITLVETFINVQMEKGYRTAFILSLETLLLSTLGYYIVTYQPIRAFTLDNPWIILLVFGLIIFLGRWKGLRVSEYIRFRKVWNQNV